MLTIEATLFFTLEEALSRIATGPRPDGTYNLGREACQQIAQDALDRVSESYSRTYDFSDKNNVPSVKIGG